MMGLLSMRIVLLKKQPGSKKHMKYVKLSYNIKKKMPVYPGTKPLSIRRIKEIAKKDSCNTCEITFSNHIGTHIDAPRHFFNSGRAISSYSMKELVFKKPILVNCPKDSCESIEIEDLMSLTKNKTKPDLLFLRTGFSKYRGKNSYNYSYKNPFLAPSTAEWIRKEVPSIKALAIDCVSIASYSNRKYGAKTHRILLTESGFKGLPVLIIEDLCIPTSIDNLDEIAVLPFSVEGIDSAPCTVIGVIHD